MAKPLIPTYGIDHFRSSKPSSKPYQIELFDSKREFKVEYPHRHDDFFEILFIVEGSGSYTIDFKTYNIHPNCIFFLSPGQIHEISYSKDIKGFIFLFTDEFYHLNKKEKYSLLEFPFFYNLENENPPLELHPHDVSFLKTIFEKGIEEFSKAQPDNNLIMSLLDMTLSYAANISPELNTESPNSKGKLLVKRYKQLIEERYHENLAVKDYADMLSVTPNYLTESVNNITGKSSKELINEKLILETKRLLIHTELTVTEIAFQLNYPDQSYFTRFFKKKVGMTPVEFRKEG